MLGGWGWVVADQLVGAGGACLGLGLMAEVEPVVLVYGAGKE